MGRAIATRGLLSTPETLADRWCVCGAVVVFVLCALLYKRTFVCCLVDVLCDAMYTLERA